MNDSRKSAENKLIETAKALFGKYGIRKVSVEEICREAGVSKMTFYRHFSNKDDIAIKTLGYYFTEKMETLEHILDENILFEEKLRKIVEIKMMYLKDIDNELVKEVFSDRETAPGKFIGELLDEQRRRTREIFARLQKKGEIRGDIKVELVMYVMENLWQAFADEELLKLYSDKAKMYEELIKTTYYGLLPA